MQYDAFGETLTRSGSTATPVQFAGTSGYHADAATGLLLLGHRYYDASIGRFLSSDPAQAGSNWYAYCDNNPLVRLDPTGLFPWWKDIVDGAKDVARDIGIDKIKDGVGKMWRKITKSKDDLEKSIDKAEDDIDARLDRLEQAVDEINQKLDRLIEHLTNPTEGTGPSNPPPAQDGIPEGYIGPNGEIIGGDGTVELPVDLF